MASNLSSLSPPPPPDLSAYSRSMHLHTKRQMESILSSSAQHQQQQQQQQRTSQSQQPHHHHQQRQQDGAPAEPTTGLPDSVARDAGLGRRGVGDHGFSS
ncbi:hypothetical protein VTJ04DRAFT_6232 [Mycothermus thermophilus]|uniref:uncharacterized protein n=1 Tax=Humicola insolens TaxID=85995 RepID=UPI003744125F